MEPKIAIAMLTVVTIVNIVTTQSTTNTPTTFTTKLSSSTSSVTSATTDSSETKKETTATKKETTVTATTKTTVKPPKVTAAAPTMVPTPPPVVPPADWQDMDEVESTKLVNFVVSEIQKLKVEHKEMDECQDLNLSSILSGKKLVGKITKYSITLKVQPQIKNTEACLQQNATLTNVHDSFILQPEICEADVTQGDHGGTTGLTLLRSTCLQVEELQD